MTRLFVPILFIVLFSLSVARAEKMDLSTHNIVIEKLENILSETEAQDIKRIDLTRRLADLYSERARIENMQESEQNLAEIQSKKDRERALYLYRDLLTRVSKKDQAEVLMLMAHLYRMAN